MISKYKKGYFRFLAIILSLAIITSLTSPVYATDDVKTLEQNKENLENNLSSLKKELEKLNKDIDSITSEIRDMNTRISELKEELAIAKGEEETRYAAMKTRIQYMYENGSTNLLEILLSASSLPEFIKRAEYFATITEYDRQEAKKLASTRESILQKEQQLTEEKEHLTGLLNSLDKKETLLRSKISSTSSELTTYTAKLDKARQEAKKTEATLNKEVKPVIPPKQEPAEPDDTKEPEEDYTATASDLELFAALIECEAGSRDYEGMLAVASVVVNRMKHSNYPNTLRGVIFQSGQFPPAHNGKVDKVLKRGVKNSCLQAAQDALNGKNNVGDCLSFRSASSGHVGTIIGDNVFS